MASDFSFFESVEFLIRIITAIVCGGIIGLERQLHGKPAGMRTSILICLGTQFYISLARDLAGPSTDPTRVLGQVITGIGFLGAGVIMAREGIVKGITSASVIWMLAAIGSAIGLDRIAIAITMAFITVFILTGIEIIEKKVHKLTTGSHRRDGNSG